VRALFTVLAVATFSGSLLAQAPARGKPNPSTPAASVEDYVYRPDGRRDPFVNLIGAGTDPQVVSRRSEGPGGFGVAEISVRGIMQSRGTLVAMIQGPDNKTYVIHQGDKLADGVVKSVTPQGLVVMQNISDPLSVQKQREVRKLLRSLEDAKERL
jgi:Tfp pilus assembly protein PilP